VADARYELQSMLGRGNFGEVHQARQVHLDRVVALKLIWVRPEAAEEVLGEARTLASLPEHDNVVRVTDAGEWERGRVYIASELCTGGSLEDLRDLTPGLVCDLVSQACRGLAHLHHHRLLHLDVRPANILLNEGVPRLVDFGLARWVDEAEVHDWYGPHAAPELIESGTASPASDVFAMAMTTAHLLTGGDVCRPFPTGVALVEACANGEWPRLHELPISVPTRVAKLLKAATTYDAAARPQDATAFKGRLDKVTPAVSFRAPDSQGTLVSGDGRWQIHQRRAGNGWLVEVTRDGRRRNGLAGQHSSKNASDKYLTKLVQAFADGRV
jgi:serine/threonine protein kinase